MELKRINREGLATLSSAPDSIQHEAVRRIEQRQENERRRAKAIARARFWKGFLELLLILALGGGVAWFFFFSGKGLEGIQLPPILGGEESTEEVERGRVTITPAKPVEYAKIEKSFASATLDYWRNAPDSDQPNKANKSLTFLCWVPTDHGGKEIYELTTAPKKKMVVRRLSPNRGWCDYPTAQYDQQVRTRPYIIMREGRAYFSSATQKGGGTNSTQTVPDKNGTFVCGSEDFGPLLDTIKTGKVGVPHFAYKVAFRPAKTKRVIDVGVFPLAHILTRADFVRAAENVLLPDIVVNNAELLCTAVSENASRK